MPMTIQNTLSHNELSVGHLAHPGSVLFFKVNKCECYNHLSGDQTPNCLNTVRLGVW